MCVARAAAPVLLAACVTVVVAALFPGLTQIIMISVMMTVLLATITFEPLLLESLVSLVSLEGWLELVLLPRLLPMWTSRLPANAKGAAQSARIVESFMANYIVLKDMTVENIGVW